MIRVTLTSFRNFPKQFDVFQLRSLCTKNTSKNVKDGVGEDGDLGKYEAYSKIDNLDFATAAKILFQDSPKKKKFGIDFHLVQLISVCLPSLAVFLIAKYARYDIRIMNEKREKKKHEEEEKAKEIELSAAKAKKVESDEALSEVKRRLEKLEESVMEIVVESKKRSVKNANKEELAGKNKLASSVEPKEETTSAAEAESRNQNSDAPKNDLKGGTPNEKK